MTPLQIALLGGCLNTGFGIVPPSKLYHRIMARRLEEESGRRVRISLGRFDSHQRDIIFDRASDLFVRSKPDVLILQLRPGFFWGMVSALWVKREGSGLSRLTLNPHHLYGDQWPDGVEESISPLNRFSPWNLALSRVTGMANKGCERLKRYLNELHERCSQHQVSLVLIAPLFSPYYHSSINHHVMRRVVPEIAQLGITLINPVDELATNKSASWADNMHLGEQGHIIIARHATEAVRQFC